MPWPLEVIGVPSRKPMRVRLSVGHAIEETAMPVWRTIPVQAQPELTLKSWRVYELPSGDRHLVGYCIQNREGRVSSAVRTLDAVALRAITRRGRVYELSGQPGVNLDAEYVWNRWAGLNSVTSWTDVTEAFWNDHTTKTDVRPQGIKPKQVDE